jgi:hypothetical protein
VERGYEPHPDKPGKLRRRTITKTFKTEREAQRWVRDTLHAIDQGVDVEPSKATLREWRAEWLAIEKARGASPPPSAPTAG